MKQLTLIIWLIALSFSIKAQSQNSYSGGFTDSLTSKVLNEQRKLLIYTPYADKKIKTKLAKRYPVLYVLDGENHFKAVAAIVQQLSDYGTCPEMIVVGIINTDRGRDLTPSAVTTGPDAIKNSGGGDRFISFMEKELIPYIDNNYSTAPYKILMGHSLGGLMTISTLTNHKDLFSSYIAIDAAIWWDGHQLLKVAKTELTKQGFSNKTLFLTMANRMEKGMDTTGVQRDTAESTELIRYNLELVHHINAHPKTAPKFAYRFYENESHGTVTFISSYDALRFIFRDYPIPKSKLYQTDNPMLAKLIINHYQNLTNQLGYQINPDAQLVNNFGYRAMALKQMDLAKELFMLNITNYPKDANLMDSMGDYYAQVNDKPNAIIWYQKTLTLVEIPETRKKLNALKN